MRNKLHTEWTLESSVSAAATVLHGMWRRVPVRLVATDGADSGFGADQAHLHGALEHLAGAGTHEGRGPSLRAALGRGRDGGGLVVLTTRAARADLVGLAGDRRSGSLTVVLVEDHGDRPASPLPDLPPGTLMVRLRAGGSLAAAWRTAVNGRPEAVT